MIDHKRLDEIPQRVGAMRNLGEGDDELVGELNWRRPGP